MLLPILKFPDQRLRDKSTPVSAEEISHPEFQALLENMFETMYTAPGVGLAAVQIGVLQRVMVLDIGINEGQLIKRDPKVIVNPEIVHREGKITWEEGCLSCPDLIVPVERSQRVLVKYLDRAGKPQEIEGQDLLAVALQHEVDHMDGVLILDRLSRLKADLYREKLLKGEKKQVVVR
jgi:peptide deformylase